MTPREAALLTESRNVWPVLTFQEIVDLVIEQKVKPTAAAGKWRVSGVFGGLVDADGRRIYIDSDDRREVKGLMEAAGWKFETDTTYATWLSWDRHATEALEPVPLSERMARAKQRRAETLAVRGPRPWLLEQAK